MKKMRIGIIGGGNMGEALIKGLHAKHHIYVFEASEPRIKYLKKKYPVIIVGDLKTIQMASVIILAVKPQDMQAAFLWIRSDDSREDKLFISIAAGLPTKYFENLIKNIVLQPKPRVVRAMPNMPALINEGVTGICKGEYASKTDLKTAQKILSTIGQTVIVKESMMDAVTAVSGSGPGYVFLFVEQWIAAAVSLGFSKDIAKRLVVGTLIGSAHLMRKANFTVRDLLDLRKKVTSKGGTTQAAMDVFFNENIFGNLIKKALEAAQERAKELSK